jgi:DNA-binding CsgD family transcriptional regulator
MNKFKHLENFRLFSHANHELFQGVLEGLTDGILILTEQGDWIYENQQARQICQQLNQNTAPINTVPQEIWRVCQALMDSRSFCCDRPIMIESEVAGDRGATVRIRARWLTLSDAHHPYLIVLLEDCHESMKSRAIGEVQQYQLTSRQAEVWLLHRLGYSYREIAAELYIAFDTVKKHMKDIHAKQRVLVQQNRADDCSTEDAIAGTIERSLLPQLPDNEI